LPFLIWSEILLYLLRQSLFILPGSFDAIRFQSLTEPAATTGLSLSPTYPKRKPDDGMWTYADTSPLPGALHLPLLSTVSGLVMGEAPLRDGVWQH
jgi:hypothetical protein